MKQSTFEASSISAIAIIEDFEKYDPAFQAVNEQRILDFFIFTPLKYPQSHLYDSGVIGENPNRKLRVTGIAELQITSGIYTKLSFHSENIQAAYEIRFYDAANNIITTFIIPERNGYETLSVPLGGYFQRIEIQTGNYAQEIDDVIELDDLIFE